LEKTSECGLRAHNGTVGETLRSPIEPSVTLPMVHATECQLSRRVFGDKEDFYFFSFLEKRELGVWVWSGLFEMRERNEGGRSRDIEEWGIGKETPENAG